MKLLAIPIVILALALLIGIRFQAVFAGEKGYKAHVSAVSESGETIKRGQSMSTITGEIKKFTLETGNETETFYLDEKTEVKLLASDEEVPKVQLIEGRIVIKGHSDLQIRDVRVEGSGTTAYTFYSWLDALDVAQLEGTIDLFIDEISHPIPSRTFRIDTLPPHDPPQPNTFNANTSAAKDFYTWALN